MPMLKAVVLDSGWGGEMFADFLEGELKMIEVERVIDWREGAYAELTHEKIKLLVEAAAKPYVGKVAVIVLASYVATVVALEELKTKYPTQRFVGFEPKLSEKLVKKEGRRRVLMLACDLVRESREYLKEKERLKRFEIIEPCCQDWTRQVDDGEMDEKKARIGLAGTGEIDIVLLYGTNFLDMKELLEKIYGWGVWVVDDFQRVLREVCAALKLKGVDGRRKK